jgi:hypothetical protein
MMADKKKISFRPIIAACEFTVKSNSARAEGVFSCNND